MADSLVTVATFDDPVAATMTKNYLESEGIPASLMDETTVATAWMLSNAMGGIKLQVPRLNLERAELLLVQMAEDNPAETEPASSANFAIPEHAKVLRDVQDEWDEEHRVAEVDKKPCNQNVDRLYRATIFGLVFPPLQLYALLLLAHALGDLREISPDRRWKVWVSVLLSIPIMGSIFLLASIFWPR